ncbi:MAG: 3-phosphoshikimate 1-carboxyvinyltransferase [Clostridia bacterium]|nr:3-phosphoshikimate 1-carboxyvinyltransferase [Clostridia bacterium]
MNVVIEKCRLKGEINAPASKSMAHRLLICAGLSEGESVIDNVAWSEDILATLDCLSQMGAEIEKGEASVKIKGVSPEKIKESKSFPARESGSTLRFFIPLALLSDVEHSFTGYGRLMERPMEVYENICREKDFLFLRQNGSIKLKGKLSSGNYTVRGDISSQFISGLLFALVLCEGDSRICLTGKVESRSYIDMTLSAMKDFGVSVIWEDDRTLYIRGSQKYRSGNFTVEGDYSNAAFPDAFNYVSGEVSVRGLKEDSLQGDKVYKEYFRKLYEGPAELDVSDCPDLAPVLMTLACVLNGAVLKGTARLKIKESDRGAVMKQELSAFGADIELFENEIIIRKSPLHKSEMVLSGHNDHRVVMSLTVISSLFGGEIQGAEAVKKSYPDFFDRLSEIGLEAKTYDNQ